MRSDAIGILGGTFDPIHYGHLRLADDVRRQLDLPEVRLIPAGEPPHREKPVASAPDRLAMTELGCAEFAGLSADDREIRRHGPSYTVLTLEELHEEQPMRPLLLLIGADAFAGLAGWHRWERLFTLAHFVVVERPGRPLDLDALPEPLRNTVAAPVVHRSRAARAPARRLDLPAQRDAAADIRDRDTRGAGARRRGPQGSAQFAPRVGSGLY